MKVERMPDTRELCMVFSMDEEDLERNLVREAIRRYLQVVIASANAATGVEDQLPLIEQQYFLAKVYMGLGQT